MDLSALGLPTLQNNASGVAGRKLSEDFDTFLTLLTSQLKNQDPLEPLKSEQFTQQLVQFSQVEQQIATNDNLESLVSLSLANQHGALVDYIGKSVEGVSDRARLTDGGATWRYELDEEAENVSILISNSQNRPIRAVQASGEAGLNSFDWDGRDDLGNTMPDGVYRISISAVDGEGTKIPATIRAGGIVDGVEVVDGVAQLTVNGAILPLSDVTAVSAVTSED
ncbi:flagellar hook assembly protein FlgD [Minwuia thermotolerans]|uniref:Basal-body rod modification protein FlgD n=1 Tax=Minwuia thermotolerans TaxID=2056226 RepID=A0A2M9FYB3_9PROT|nr:flagellar hook assembly protein FlgD [Minwuia thermotolerans]PJK28453.1 flagellar hook capping protein [Minwuia thermotolerans]